MKRNILLLFIFLFSVICGFAQIKSPVKKVFAYKQASIPGIQIDHSGDTNIKTKEATIKTERRQNYNYWFYLSMSKTEKVVITGLWIDGIQYTLKSETISSLPVKKIIYTGLEKNDTAIMVPVTTNKILLIYPGAEKANDSKYALNLARTNELVIRYTWKGKSYYSTTKNIKELTPDVRV